MLSDSILTNENQVCKNVPESKIFESKDIIEKNTSDSEIENLFE